MPGLRGSLAPISCPRIDHRRVGRGVWKIQFAARWESLPVIEFFQNLFDTSDFPARWRCGTWTSGHGWVHIISDLAIFGAYFAIPASLVYFLRKRRDVPLRGVFWLFIAFILCCGTTHLIEAVIFWSPIYRVSALAKVATAIVSWTTVIVLFRLMPEALSLPGLRQDNDALRREIERHASTAQALAATRDELEARSSQLTRKDRRIKDAMAAADACALRWEPDSGRVVWAVGFEHCFELCESPIRPFEDWSMLLEPEQFERLRSEAMAAHANARALETMLTVRRRGGDSIQIRVAASPTTASEGEASQMTGMFRVLLPQDETCD